MSNPKLSSEITRLTKAFGYSFEGIKAAWSDAGAFRTKVLVTIIAIPLAFMLEASGVGRALMIGSLFLVMIVELLNTGIEDAINRISLELHPLSKRAKDVASAAVLFSIINAFTMWVLVLWS